MAYAPCWLGLSRPSSLSREREKQDRARELLKIERGRRREQALLSVYESGSASSYFLERQGFDSLSLCLASRERALGRVRERGGGVPYWIGTYWVTEEYNLNLGRRSTRVTSSEL